MAAARANSPTFGSSHRATFNNLTSATACSWSRSEVEDARHCGMAKDTVSSSKCGPSDGATFSDLVSVTMRNWSRKEVEDEHNGTMTRDPAKSPTFGPSDRDLTSPTPCQWSEEELEASTKEHTDLANELAETAEPALSDAVQRALLSRQAQISRATQTPCKELALGSVDLTDIIHGVLMSKEIRQMISSHVKQAVTKELEVIIPCLGNMERDFSYRIERLEAAMDKVWESETMSKVASPQPHSARATKKMPHAGRTYLESVPEASAQQHTKETRSASPTPRQQPPGPNTCAARHSPADAHRLVEQARGSDHLRGKRGPSPLQRPRSGRTTTNHLEELVAESLFNVALPGMCSPPPEHSPSPRRAPPSSKHEGSKRGRVPNAVGSGGSGHSISVLPGSSQASGSSSIRRSSSWSSFDSDCHGTDDMSTLPSGSTNALKSKKTSFRLRSLFGKNFGWRSSPTAQPASTSSESSATTGLSSH